MVKSIKLYFIIIFTCFVIVGCTLGEDPIGFERDADMVVINDKLCKNIPQNKAYYLSVVSVKNKDGSGLRKTIDGSELMAVNNKRCMPLSLLPASEKKEYVIHYGLLSRIEKLPSFRKVASIRLSNGRVYNLSLKNMDYFPRFLSE
ncbi:putative T6SS immunity periplasmic lipoprotein [Erwinia sp. S59]|uniref:putative T6SS immunity periplasmic lipoprotein n=1 Tax=Erwinia sp. S59 TaxID=2769340 RepID=UPI001909FA8C|nr:putative T6SS immunity periplasmic lipoprotein [Erwinia sp. S59]MBK0090087.1 hypothetical protein [Erwinia sp. S59]